MNIRIISWCVVVLTTTQSIKAQVYPPLTESLSLAWVDSATNGNFYDDQRPLIKKGILFPYNNVEYAIDIKSGSKLFYKDSRQYLLNLFKDSLLLFDTKERATVLNVFSGNVVLEVEKKYGAYNGYLLPTFVDNFICIKTDKNNLEAYDIISGEKKWDFRPENSVYTQPIAFREEVVFCDKTTIYALDRDSGHVLWKKSLGERVTSNITVSGSVFYMWVLPRGLIAFNSIEKSVIWEYSNFADQYGNYTLPISGDTIFFVNEHLYAINKVTGDIIWKSDEDCAIGSGYIASVSDLLIYYEGCSAGDVEFISAIEKHSGKKIYQGLTSSVFPPDNAEDPLNLSSIDYKKLKFIANNVGDMTFAIAEGIIYAFKITK